MWKVFAACTLAVLTALAADDPKKDERGARGGGRGPEFHAQIGQRLSTHEDSLHLFVAVSVAYDNLIFLRADTGFAASFELVTAVYDDHDGLVAERIGNIRVTSLTYAETNSRTRNAIHAEEFLVAPGDYTIKVTMTNESEPKLKSKWEGKIKLAPSDPALRISDIFWLQEDTALASLGMPRIVEYFYSSEDSARARVQWYSHGPANLRLIWSVVSEKGDTVFTERRELVPADSVQTADYAIGVRGLAAQAYELRLVAAGNGKREERMRKFGVRIPGVPPSITNLEQAIRQLKYIATSEENKRLRQASPREREQAFREFWKKRDPTPNSEQNELLDEYYLRVQYSNENFATNREGWETDRGRIYITYGPPTDIERHPFEADRRPYEIWYYAQIARRFVFVDYTGFGDYTLASPEWGY